MNNQDNEKVFQKSQINWLITVYSNFWTNPLFIMICED